ncbi:hypothetical protein O6H91_06G108000 [Diphasiastrum complanatum]|uniref:Uncharacterized protein n=1 Tax=Diphasiastrum complanatum TaxID=34168 RepID=A0ACC2DHN9_DIPCM|nr:hypothetical protein O6H91_06G108000 [Diphasiastrum complanatum]
MSGTARFLRSVLCSATKTSGSFNPCCAERGARIRSLSAGRGASGQGSGGPSYGDFKIDFSKYFNTPTANPSSDSSSTTPAESEPNSKETPSLHTASAEDAAATSEGNKNLGKTGRGILDILSGGEDKGPGSAPADKFKLDLSKLFLNAEQNAARSTGEGSADGPSKPFKLNLSRLKNLSAPEDNAKFGDKHFRPNVGRPARPASSNLSDSARREISLQKLGHLSRFGSPQSYGFNVLAPKEHMLEKYFAPENMSLAARRKIELKDIRETFKMHNADCGSTPVQISLLTQKIKHLSNHLSQHKKDKHSRRGLEAMIENRRRLLIYFRRKDWEAYCYMLSTLGLRDKLEVAKA